MRPARCRAVDTMTNRDDNNFPVMVCESGSKAGMATAALRDAGIAARWHAAGDSCFVTVPGESRERAEALIDSGKLQIGQGKTHATLTIGLPVAFSILTVIIALIAAFAVVFG